jgi:HNH endonuclease/Protein of unknown function (DUF1376)
VSQPDPFVSADVDISGMPGFMMDVQRLFASELWAISNGDEFKAAMALWGRAWQQTPAGSLPNDERLLAAFSGAGSRWKKVRAVALRGFVECSDGRLYHREIADNVNQAWAARLKILARFDRRLEMASGAWHEVRTKVFHRDDFTCQYCGVRGVKLECDHVLPRSKGGKSHQENLVTACFKCNRSKGSKLIKEWRQ